MTVSLAAALQQRRATLYFHLQKEHTMNELLTQKCTACRADAPAATPEEIEKFRAHIPDWKITEENGVPRLQREYSFSDFQSALDFTNKVGALAEDEGHHPAITTEYGKVTVAWWTHKIKNIHRNDLIMAAKTDSLRAE
jgi:4a-hydroxytetrahydrobiopterin dehydratase